MPTALYTTDVQKITDRTPKTTLVDTDVFVVANSSGTLAPITKVNTKETLGINANATAITTLNGDVSTAGSVLKVVKDNAQNATYDPATSGLTATTLKTAIDELADEKANQTDLETLETTVDTNRLYSDSQYLDLKAKYDAQQIALNASKAELYTDDPILQFGSTDIIGKGTKADYSAIDVSANVVDGKLSMEQKGLTIRNIVNGASIANLGTVTFATILNDKYYDTLNNAILTGTGSDITATNNSGATANMAIYHLNALGLSTITDTDILAQLLPYVSGTKNVGKMGMQIVGNQMFDKSVTLDDNSIMSTTGAVDTGGVGFYASDFIRVQPSTAYAVSHAVLGSGAYNNCWYDKDKTFISAWTIGQVTATSPANAKFIRVTGRVSTQTKDLFMLNLGSSAIPYEPYQEQLTFLPAIGNSLPNGVADSIKTVADGLEHTKRVSDRTLLNVDYFISLQTNADNVVAYGDINFLTSIGGVEDSPSISFEAYTKSPNVDLSEQTASDIGKWSITGTRRLGFVFASGTTLAQAKTALANTYFIYQLATPITTHYDLPHLTSGKTIHRFAGEEKIALYGTGLTFSENVLTVLSAVKFVAGIMTDITSLATITGATVTFSGVSATDVVYVKVEHDVDRPLGIFEHTPAVSNTASRLAALEAAVFGG